MGSRRCRVRGLQLPPSRRPRSSRLWAGGRGAVAVARSRGAVGDEIRKEKGQRPERRLARRAGA
eukprot:8423168-Pyramimonas_sp.AAC.1